MMGGYYMGGISLFWMLIVSALIVIPFWRLLPKFGIPNWVAVFTLFPLVALVLLWVLAFKDDLDGKGVGA